jgi:hypothetical protein
VLINIFFVIRDKIMDLSTNRTFLRVNERRIRAENMIYLTDSQDFFVTTYDSYKKAQSERKTHYGASMTLNSTIGGSKGGKEGEDSDLL